MSSGGVTGSHRFPNTGAPVVVIGRKGSYGTVHWSQSAAFVIDTAYFVDRSQTRHDLRWLYYVLAQADLKGQSQDVGVPGLSREAAYEVLVPTPPPLEEQRRIVDFLDDQISRIDDAIAKRGRQLQLIDERVQSSLDEEFKRLFDVGGAVELRRLTTHIEQGWTPVCESRVADPDEPGVLKLGSVRRGAFIPQENKAFAPDVLPIPELRVRDGDLLLSRANTPMLVGEAAVVEGAGERHLYLCDLLYRVGLLETVAADFVAAALRTRHSRDSCRVVARGTSDSMVKLRGEDILNLRLPIVSNVGMREVGKAATEARRAHQEREAVWRRSERLMRERKQALITAAVTDEFDVSSAVSRAAAAVTG